MPEPAGAGKRRMLTGAPEWSPTPSKAMGSAIVCSRWAGLANQHSNCAEISVLDRLDANSSLEPVAFLPHSEPPEPPSAPARGCWLVGIRPHSHGLTVVESENRRLSQPIMIFARVHSCLTLPSPCAHS